MISQILLICAFACFLVEVVQHRSLIAGGLACWVLATLLVGKF